QTINEPEVRSETIRVRRANERGHAQYDWLDTWHTFSFNTYYDPAYMGFRSLRVINEDWVQPGKGFGMHGHRDMEIITYVLDGAVEHRDSMGTGSVLRAGEFQHMTAGSGIRHSEFNPSSTESIHLYQIWLLPEQNGLSPSYDQKTFPEFEKRGRLRLVASPDAKDGSLLIHQDARIFLSLLESGQEVSHELHAGRHAWLQVLRGAVDLNGHRLATSDGAAVSDETELTIRASEASEVMLFDLA
ncbi:MAG: pirin family protein, partial [Thermoguttaceae bacterium]